MSKPANSTFVQQLEHEVNRIKDIIKKPRLVETKFKTLVSLHEGIEEMINEYIKTSSETIKVEVEDILKKWSSKFRTEYKEDLKRIDELNSKYLKGKKNVSVPNWSEVVGKTVENVVGMDVELFDSCIYGEMNEYVDVNLKKEDLERKEVKEMIKAYNELREEVEDGLDEVVENVRDVEKKWMKVREKLEDKGKKWLEVMYVCHLNYIKAALDKRGCDVRVNGMEIKGKQTEWLKGWLSG